MIHEELERLEKTTVSGTDPDVTALLAQYQSTPLKSGSSLADLIRRPELSYDALAVLDSGRPPLPQEVCEQVNINLKYEGYIERQKRQVEAFQRLERKQIPAEIDYNEIKSLRLEARQKLSSFRPVSVGQASRISGVSPADISVLLVYLHQLEHGIQK